ncbi:MAG TPA: (4Fe-4S)-binding protein, partial [Tissierellaceae bacterium]
MKIAVLSGKGGVGKTFISTNLSRVSRNSYYLDCDIEEPNGHLFFNRENIIYKNI